MTSEKQKAAERWANAHDHDICPDCAAEGDIALCLATCLECAFLAGDKHGYARAKAKLDWLRNNHEVGATCTEGECVICGVIDCPDGEPLHYHHDGCPACNKLMGMCDCPALKEARGNEK
jgi:hypothetical protein